MPKHRSYSTDFKRQIAQEFLAGETLHGLAKRHVISRNLSLRSWERGRRHTVSHQLICRNYLGKARFPQETHGRSRPNG